MLGRIALPVGVLLLLTILDIAKCQTFCPEIISCPRGTYSVCRININGCRMCKCMSRDNGPNCPPLAVGDVKCSPSETRRVVDDGRGCMVVACTARPLVSRCTTPSCAAHTPCSNGFLRINGCISPTCQCIQSNCPERRCFTNCRSGFRLDVQGCPTCVCRSRNCRRSNCQELVCAGSSISRRVVNGCSTCFCNQAASSPNAKQKKEKASTVKIGSHSTVVRASTPCKVPAICPKMKCSPGQKQLQKDSTGCSICICTPVCSKTNCDYLVCPANSVLKQQVVSGCPNCFCKAPPRPPRCPTSMTCPKIYCKKGQQQFESDKYGCLHCFCTETGSPTCHPSNCNTLVCPRGTVEEVLVDGCPACSCRPTAPSRETTRNCPSLRCLGMVCRGGFSTDATGCPTCRCKLSQSSRWRPLGFPPIGIRPSGRRRTGMRPTGTIPSAIRARGITPVGIRPTGIRTSGKRETGIKPVGIRPTGIRTSGKRVTGIKPVGIRPTGTRPSGKRETGITRVGIRPTGTRPSGIRQTVIKPVGIRPSGTRPSGKRETGFTRVGIRPTGTRPSGIRQTVIKPVGIRPSGTRPSGKRETGITRVGIRPTGTRPSGIRDIGFTPFGILPPRMRPLGMGPYIEHDLHLFPDVCPAIIPGHIGTCGFECGGPGLMSRINFCRGGRVCCPTDCGGTTCVRPSLFPDEISRRCPPWIPEVDCFIDPCRFARCRRYPTATCVPNYCGDCNAEFFMNGRRVFCSRDMLFFK